MTSTREDAQTELTDFVRARTELECIVQDLQNAGLRAGGKREEYETELRQVEDQIEAREASLAALLPDWEATRAREATERRALDEANAKLGSLFAKQGRGAKFRTKPERDAFLKQEITSMGAYKTTQAAALQTTKAELRDAQRGLNEVDTQITGVQGKIEDGRKKVKSLTENIAGLKEKQAELTEKRKDMWREDTKLDSLVSRAASELKNAERALAGMMDKVSK